MDENTNLNEEQPKEEQPKEGEKKIHFSPLIAGIVFLVVVVILAILVYAWQKWDQKSVISPETPGVETMPINSTGGQQPVQQLDSIPTNTNSGGLIMPQEANPDGSMPPGPANIPTVAPPGSENIPKGTKEMQYPVPPGVGNVPSTPPPSGPPVPSATDDEAANYAQQFTAPPVPPTVNMNMNSSYSAPPVAPPTSITNTNTNKKK